MATIVLRLAKGTPLTNLEVDGNFSNINSELSTANTNTNIALSNIGVLSALTTSNKSNLVSAINEIASESTSNVSITGGTIGGTAGWQANVIAIAYGGTNANSASSARVNLELGSQNNVTFGNVITTSLTGNINANSIITTPQLIGTKEKKIAMAASDIDLSQGSVFTKTISSTTTLTVSSIASSGTVNSFLLELTNGGAYTVNYFANVKWQEGSAPTLTASGKDVLGFYTHDGGIIWNGFVLGFNVY